MEPDLRNTKSAKSLTGWGLSTLFKKGHALVFLPTLGLVDRAFRKKADAQHCAISHSRFRSRSFKFRWEHSPAWAAHPTGDLTLNGSASFSGISVAGASGNHRLHLYVYFFPVRDETEPQSRIGQFCSDLRKPRDYKSGSAQRGSEEPQSAPCEGQGEIRKPARMTRWHLPVSTAEHSA